MRNTMAAVAAAVAGGAITYVLFGFVAEASWTVRLVVAVAVTIVGVVVALVAAPRSAAKQAPGVSVASDVRTARDIVVDDVVVDHPSEAVRVGDGLRAGGSARVSGVRIEHGVDDG
jgi:hypothetical protein